ncbi:MAG: HigA family addiction module antitoxin [Aestuariivirga sp.]
MEMFDPPHPGLSIKDELEELGIPVAAAAKSMGVTRQQLYRVMRGECAITPEMAVRLEKSIGGAARLWLAMQASHDLWHLKRAKLKPAPRKIVSKAA